MAFNGYLIMVGKTKETASLGAVLPLKYMRYETYQVNPDQVMDFNTTRDTTGVLHRTVLGHTATKIEFTTPRMSNTDVENLMVLLRRYWNNEREKRLGVFYYDPLINDYKSGWFYMPDINFTISNVDARRGKIMYTETRIAFIEY